MSGKKEDQPRTQPQTEAKPQDVLALRRAKAAELTADGVPLFPNDFRPDHCLGDIRKKYDHLTNDELTGVEKTFAVAGRMMFIRSFGKAAFVKIQDRSGDLQIHVKKNVLTPEEFALFRKLEAGDIIGVTGPLFRTRTDELTVEAASFRLLTKSMRPLPEKFHGLTDKQTRYRQRYLDLMVNPETRDTFIKRTRTIKAIRNFMDSLDYVEVETPMMQPLAGGANARPFTTHHNALSLQLFLRIAPELYLKRLVVGGIERVYEINRNFRNEGIDLQHNPEFTMLEFYQAYATYEDMMDITERMFAHAALEVTGSTTVPYTVSEEEEYQISLEPPFRRVRFDRCLVEMGGAPEEILTDEQAALDFVRTMEADFPAKESHAKLLEKIFDLTVEPKLIQPTFVTHYPTAISPLSRRNDEDPSIVDRFELFCCGREMANAFSELNDPDDQRSRFEAQLQAKAAGDDEAHPMDEDYIRALEYGMPPAGGEGVGIDRLVMLLTNARSIRDVILFPLLRPEAAK